jgi:hypothetical protein
LVTIATLWYCLSNFAWDIPNIDFRPFKDGVNVREQKKLEEDAMANVEILGYILTNKETGEEVSLDYPTYLKTFKDYPKENWDSDVNMSEPTVASTKISDFHIEDAEGFDVTEEILDRPNYSFMIVAHKLPAHGELITRTVFEPFLDIDISQIQIDTTDPEGTKIMLDSIQALRDSTIQREVTEMEYTWDDRYKEDWKMVDAFLEEGQDMGIDAYAIVGGASPEMIKSLAVTAEFQFPVYLADDILLKTIVRSNPGIVLLKDGRIVEKWHKSKLPSFEDVRTEYIK